MDHCQGRSPRLPYSDETDDTASPSETRRALNSSDETTATSVSSPREAAADKPATLPLLTEPSPDEADMYYQWLPSQPVLLGRTSAGIQPWSRYMAAPRLGSWDANAADIRMACGPVGPHPLHGIWETGSIRTRLTLAMQGLDFHSITPLRVGRMAVPESERPVVLWIGVSRDVASAVSWPLVAQCLRNLRTVLDDDGLVNVECEIRVTEDIKTADTRYVLPPRGFRKIQNYEEANVERAISTSVGKGISPRKQPSHEGTLGLYLGPADSTGGVNKPVWAITCHHVVCPPQHVVAKDPDNTEIDGGVAKDAVRQSNSENTSKSGGNNMGSDKCYDGSDEDHARDVLMPCNTELDRALENAESICAELQGLIGLRQGPPNADSMWVAASLERATRLRETLVTFGANHKNRVLGQLYCAPLPGANNHPGESKFTRDWALIALDQSKFPDNFGFENIVDLKTETANPISSTINVHLQPPQRFVAPVDSLMRLEGIIPLREMRSAQIAHGFVKIKDEEPCLVVLKRGRRTGLTVGIALDLRTMHRTSLGGEIVETIEWTIIHISLKRYDAMRPLENVFSAAGDSGSAIFDLTGRVGGLLTGGTGACERGLSCSDITYATPMEHVLVDIEREIGFPVQIL